MLDSNANFIKILKNVENILNGIENIDDDDREIIISYGNDKPIDEDKINELNIRFVVINNNLESINFNDSLQDNDLSISFLIGGQHRLGYDESSLDLTILLTKYLNKTLNDLFFKFSNEMHNYNLTISEIDYVPYEYAREDVEIDENIYGDKGIYIKFLIVVQYISKI